MENPNETSTVKKEGPPFTVDEIKDRLTVLSDLEDKLHEKNMNSSDLISEIIRTRQEVVGSFLFEKDRFSKVFQTLNGSWYFQTADGYSLRAKSISDELEFGEGVGNHFKFQPIMSDMFFISPEEHERTDRKKEYPGESIKIEEYKLGVVPLEINVTALGVRVVFEKTGDRLKLIGTDWGDGKIDTEGNMVGGIHVGHPITKIEK